MEALGDEQIGLVFVTQTFFGHRPEFMEPFTLKVLPYWKEWLSLKRFTVWFRDEPI
jgi:hypothetical protein